MPSVEEVAQVPVTAPAEVGKDVEEDVIIPGPALTKEFNEKKLKMIIKEGGKRGVEIEGAADMGGLQFFCTMIEKPEGDLDLLIESVKAMNAKSDPSEEERKGGAGKLGKMVVSFTEACISLVTYVPKDKADKCHAMEWLKDVVLNIAGKDQVEQVKSFEGVDSKYWAGVAIKQADGVFPIKMRDPAISIAYNYLKARGLFPDGEDDDDDEMVFGDDDVEATADAVAEGETGEAKAAEEVKAVEEVKPEAGEETMPLAGEETMPLAGEEVKPEAGEEVKPEAGEDAKPEEDVAKPEDVEVTSKKEDEK